MTITKITNIDNKKHIALLDTSSISFMQGLDEKGLPVSYKSNDAILCQLFRDGKISIENLGDYRKDIRKITYSKVQDDHSVILVTEVVDNDLFMDLVQDTSVHIIF